MVRDLIVGRPFTPIHCHVSPACGPIFPISPYISELALYFPIVFHGHRGCVTELHVRTMELSIEEKVVILINRPLKVILPNFVS